MIATFSILGEHESEPEYGYYDTEGGMATRYDEDGEAIWHNPYAYVYYTLPDENWSDNMDLNLRFQCYSNIETKQVGNVYLAFTIDPYGDESRSLEQRVVFRFSDRVVRKDLANHADDRHYFTLTNYDYYRGGNYIEDDDLVDDVLEELLNEGTMKIEVRDDDLVVNFVVVARPAGHQSQDIFAVISQCYYGMKHPNVGSESSTMVFSKSSPVSADSLWKDQANRHYMNKLKLFQSPSKESVVGARERRSN